MARQRKAYMVDIDGVVCVKPDVMLLGENKIISLAEPGDATFGVTGVNMIEERFEREYDGELVQIKAQGMLPIEMTPEHPLLVVTSKTSRSKVFFDRPIWKRAADVKVKFALRDGDYLLLPRIKGNIEIDRIDLREFVTPHGADICKAQSLPLSLPLNDKTAWLLGLYVAEGCVIRDSSRNNSLAKNQFSLGRTELPLVERLEQTISDLGYTPLVRSQGSVTMVQLQSRVLAKAISHYCGVGACNKTVPEVILLHKNISLLGSFLEGYLNGDGSSIPNGFAAITVSRVLALQLQLLCARLGIPLCISMKQTDEFGYIQGRRVSLHNKYRMQSIVTSGPRRKMKIFPDYILCPVRKVERVSYAGKVYNVRTTDNTYLACNAVVHNCEHVPNEFPEKMKTASEISGAREWVNSRYEKGNYICFFTARLEEHRKITEKWLDSHGFKYHQIIFGKPRGGNYHYIDRTHVQATTFRGKFSPMVSETHGIEVFED